MLFIKICFGGTITALSPSKVHISPSWRTYADPSTNHLQVNAYPLLKSILEQCGLENNDNNRKAIQDATKQSQQNLISILHCSNELLRPLNGSNTPLQEVLKVIQAISKIPIIEDYGIFQTQVLSLWVNGMEIRSIAWCQIICICSRIHYNFLEKTITNIQAILKYHFLTQPMTLAAHFKILRTIFQNNRGLYCVHAMALITLAQTIEMSPDNYAKYIEQHILSTLYCINALLGSFTEHPIPKITRLITHMSIETQVKFMNCVSPLLLDGMSFEIKCQIVDHCIPIDITELETTTQNIQKIWDKNPSLSKEEKIEILTALLNSDKGLYRINEIISKIMRTKKQQHKFVSYVLKLIPSHSCCCQ